MATRTQGRERYEHVEGILRIVRDGLCHRCGACVGVCPVGTLGLDADRYPTRVAECINCNLCVKVCSGHAVDFEALGGWMFGSAYRYGTAMALTRSAGVGHATDEEVRWRGTSGGVVSQLLIHLLETGAIAGALVATADPADPALGKGIIARSRAEILAAAQSKYTTAPSLAALREIAKEKGPFAVVALPCQVHALRNLQMANKAWKDRIPLVIGLLCHYRLPEEATREAAGMMAPRGQRLERIRYREKGERGWPRNTVEMTFSDGSTWRSPFGPAQTVSLLATCYPRRRCATCVDVTAEFSDLSVGDPWIRNPAGEWKYSVPGGRSFVAVRTEAGEAALQAAVQAGRLAWQPIPAEEIAQGQCIMMSEKKQCVPLRLKVYKAFGRPIPDYSVPFPRAKPETIQREIGFLLTRLIPLWGPTRRLILRMILSGPGRAYMGRRADRNKAYVVARLGDGGPTSAS